MAMVSSGAIASVASDYLTSASTKWAAAFGALISGLISLANNMLPDNDVLQKMFDASRELDALNFSVEQQLYDPEVIELEMRLQIEKERASGEFPDLTDEAQKKLEAQLTAVATKLHTFARTIGDKRGALTREFRRIMDQAIDANRADYERRNKPAPPVRGPNY
jgi:hypothetical protein